MGWFTRDRAPMAQTEEKRTKAPEGLWIKCPSCGETIYAGDLDANCNVCPKCDFHFRISARKRLEMLLDEGSFVEHDAGMISVDVLQFKDTKSYADRIQGALSKGGARDAIICGEARLEGMPLQVSVFDFSFMGGSMGSVVAARTPFIIFSASGGARMQESILSLMQMAKTSAALAIMKEQGLPFISVLTDPTTGGVTASFAMLGDINIAEPRALIGFAGPRVIEQTIRQKLPEGFQRAEYLLDHGMVDLIVNRKEMRQTLAKLFTMLHH
jgi:acetyl-CoA carboxylase carboxyl transferase subunit beta